MKIAVISPFYPPDVTGSSLFAQHLSEELVRRGYEIEVFSCAEEKSESYTPNIRIGRIPSLRLNFKGLSYSYDIPFITLKFGFMKLFRELDFFNPNVIHIHSQIFDINLYGLIYASLRRVPVIVTVHSPFWHTQRIFDYILRVADWLFIKPLLRRASFVVNVDLQTRKYLSQRHQSVHPIEIPVSFPNSRVQNGSRKYILEKYGEFGIKEKRTVLSLGHVIPMRNRLDLVRAFSRLLDFEPELQLVIVGSLYDKSVVSLVRELEITDKVLFTGAVPEEDIKHFLALADVECHDLQGIGIGLTTMEAMRAKVPSVFWLPDDNWSDVNFRKFHLARLEDNSVESIEKELRRLLSQPEYRLKVIDAQTSFMDSFLNFDRIVDEYCKTYQDCIG